MQKLDFDNSIGIIVKNASKTLDAALEEKIRKECGLSGGKWRVIVALSEKDGITQSKIAEMIFIEGATLVSIIDGLEKDGWVQRRQDPTDRRNNRIYLTDKASGIAETIVSCILDLRKNISKDISEKEMNITKKVLKKITEEAIQYRGYCKIPS